MNIKDLDKDKLYDIWFESLCNGNYELFQKKIIKDLLSQYNQEIVKEILDRVDKEVIVHLPKTGIYNAYINNKSYLVESGSQLDLLIKDIAKEQRQKLNQLRQSNLLGEKK